jgi:hypothetical protein
MQRGGRLKVRSVCRTARSKPSSPSAASPPTLLLARLLLKSSLLLARRSFPGNGPVTLLRGEGRGLGRGLGVLRRLAPPPWLSFLATGTGDAGSGSAMGTSSLEWSAKKRKKTNNERNRKSKMVERLELHTLQMVLE